MQIKPEFEASEQFSTIAAKIADKWPAVFEGIDASEIRCYLITNKECPESRKAWELKAVPQPIRIDCPYGWYVIMYKQDWEEMDEKRQAIRVAEVLCGVGEEGKVNPFDLKDFGVMVRTLGVDYQDNANVPDILNDKVEWVMRGK